MTDIEQTLKTRFAAPLQDNYKRRIIFWQDPDRQFSMLIDELHIDGVKILKLTENNNFTAKQLLSETDTESNYLVYNPCSYADVRDNWLLDIELYSEEFRADMISIIMESLRMPDTSQMRKLVKYYDKFFNNKERLKKLAAFKSDYTNARQLHIDILSVLSGAKENTPERIIRAILTGGFDAEHNEAICSIKKFGNEEVMQRFISSYTGYICGESFPVIELAAHILLTALSATISVSHLQNLKKLISEPHRQFCFSLISEWQSSGDKELEDITREIEEHYNLYELFDTIEITDLTDSEVFPSIDECIIKKYMTEIAGGIVRADDILETAEKRRVLKWYESFSYYYDGLVQTAHMQKFYQATKCEFHTAEYEKLWKEYTDNYCKMDCFYRRFHVAFRKSINCAHPVLGDIYKDVAGYVERLYKNCYLFNLSRQWTKIAGDDLAKDSRLPALQHQSDFYRHYAESILSACNLSRVYVIISDALRYEVALELKDRLSEETKNGSVNISSMQSVFPSATKFGMAALLPHTNLQLTDNMKVLCDGKPTDTTESREKILKNIYDGNVALTHKEFMSMKSAELREKVSKAQVVYIYHNAIDAVGDKPATEHEVFEACQNAIDEIKALVRMIIRGKGTHIIITADHGFLYSYKPLDESDKAEKSFISGRISETAHRYVIADGEATAEYMLRIPLKHLNCDMTGFTPLDNIRIKTQGGGTQYVHGGVSLQEMVVPVIEFKSTRASSKNFVGVRKAEIELISQTNKISNNIFKLRFYQKEAVCEKIAKADYEVYMADASEIPVSDKHIIIADKACDNAKDREFAVRFTLKSMDFQRTAAYYLVIAEKETKRIINKIEFTIDVIPNDFDF